jgi:hypothetical protein
VSGDGALGTRLVECKSAQNWAWKMDGGGVGAFLTLICDALGNDLEGGNRHVEKALGGNRHCLDNAPLTVRRKQHMFTKASPRHHVRIP